MYKPDIGRVGAPIFSSFRDATITGGTFTSNSFNVREDKGLGILTRNVASSAFHNSKDRFDPPKCHEHTRESILDRLLQWIKREIETDALMMWIHGAAGAGKSAILQTIADICGDLGLPFASFFFSNRDGSRCDSTPVVATLAYQILVHVPALRVYVEAAFDIDPLLLRRKIEVQVEELIIIPIQRHLDDGGNVTPLVLIVDGLDECSDLVASKLLEALDHLVGFFSTTPTPILALFASRPHGKIHDVFNHSISSSLSQISLDVDYRAHEDIKRFLSDEFAKIHATHILRRQLVPGWPTKQQVDRLVSSASGQFIYASTVVNFVSSPRHQPQQRLNIVLGLAPVKANSKPFAPLDAVYKQIFMNIPEDTRSDAVRVATAVLAFRSFISLDHMSFLLDLEVDEIILLVSELSSVMQLDVHAATDDCMVFNIFHASLIEFFIDPTRSEELHADMRVLHLQFLQKTLSFYSPLRWRSYSKGRAQAIKIGLQSTYLTPSLLDSICNVPFLRGHQVPLITILEFGVPCLEVLSLAVDQDPVLANYLLPTLEDVETRVGEAHCILFDSFREEVVGAISTLHCREAGVISSAAERVVLRHIKRTWEINHPDVKSLLLRNWDHMKYLAEYFLDGSISGRHAYGPKKIGLLVAGSSGLLSGVGIRIHPVEGWMKSRIREARIHPWLWRKRKLHSSYIQVLFCMRRTNMFIEHFGFLCDLPDARNRFIVRVSKALLMVRGPMKLLPDLLDDTPVTTPAVLKIISQINLNHPPWVMYPKHTKAIREAIDRYLKRASPSIRNH